MASKAKRKGEQKRQQQVYLVVVVAIVVILAFAVVLLSNVSLTNPGTANANVGGAGDSVYDSVEQGISEEGLPQLGSPDAPVSIYNYSSFSCPHCANFDSNQFRELLNNEIRNGEVRYVLVPLSGQTSVGATVTVFCAEEQGAYWEMHDLMYALPARFGSAAAAFTLDNFLASASALELDMEAFEACLNSEEIFERIQLANGLWGELAAQYEGEVTGTPTIVINGVPPEIAPGRRSGALPIDFVRQYIAAAQG